MLTNLYLLLVQVLIATLAVGSPTKPKKVSSSLNKNKLYEPNPPVTHHVYFTFNFTHPLTKQPVTHEISIDLYGSLAPQAVKNFAEIAKSVKARGPEEGSSVFEIGYKNTKIDHIEFGKYIRGGVLSDQFRFSIHGPEFKAENFDLKLDRPGRLAMFPPPNKPDSNASEFMIVTGIDGLPEANGKNIAFGQVVSGLSELLDVLQYVETDEEGKPITDITIIYSYVQPLRIGHLEDLHQKYLQKLDDYKSGDKSVGSTLKSALYNADDAQAESDKVAQALGQTYTPNTSRGLFFIVVVVGLVAYIYRSQLQQQIRHYRQS